MTFQEKFHKYLQKWLHGSRSIYCLRMQEQPVAVFAVFLTIFIEVRLWIAHSSISEGTHGAQGCCAIAGCVMHAEWTAIPSIFTLLMMSAKYADVDMSSGACATSRTCPQCLGVQCPVHQALDDVVLKSSSYIMYTILSVFQFKLLVPAQNGEEPPSDPQWHWHYRY